MPVSTPVHISDCLDIILKVSPRSVLDIGCGFGMWGFLCRKYLDVFCGRVQPGEWEIRIDGVELFAPYIMEHHRSLYDTIHIGDIRTLATALPRYDLIIAGDVIEHLEKADAEAVLDALYDKADKALLVNLPLGDGWDHPEQHGNPGELHRSRWEIVEMTPYATQYLTHELVCGEYGVFYCAKPGDTGKRVDALLNLSDHFEKTHEVERAIAAARRAVCLTPGDERPVLLLADLLIQKGCSEEARASLAKAAAQAPELYGVRLMSARLDVALGHPDRAAQTLCALVEEPALPEALREQARSLLERLNCPI